MTVFGSVRLARMGYGQRRGESLYPRDAELSVPPEIYSHGVRRQIAEETARGSFDEAVAAVERTTGADVAKGQTEQLAARAAADSMRSTTRVRRRRERRSARRPGSWC